MKALTGIMRIGFLVLVSSVLLAQPYEGEKGDVNNDGTINVLDIITVVNHILESAILDEPGIWRADCNGSTGSCSGDGVINIFDALKIVNLILGHDSCRFESCGTVTDIDGNVYQTVIIGNQCWMRENLKVTHYCSGDPIPEITDSTVWGTLTTGAYCNYDNDADYVPAYGRLYNWHTVSDNRNIAPQGWHVPSDEEWQILVDYLGGSSVAGGKMKESGTEHWAPPNAGATNESGFTALPGGCRYNNGDFNHLGSDAIFWSSSENQSQSAWRWSLHYFNMQALRSNFNKQSGLSVRCLRD